MSDGLRDSAEYWQAEAMRLKREVAGLQAAHEILRFREWFAVGPHCRMPSQDEEGRFTLFYCDRQGTTPCVTLGPKDMLLIGRYTGEPEREEAVAALADEGPTSGRA